MSVTVVRACLRLLALGAAVALCPSTAAAAPVVLLTQKGVPQYNEVLAGFRELHPSAPAVDISDDAQVGRELAEKPVVVVAVGSRALALAKAQRPSGLILAAAVLNPATEGRTDLAAVPLETRSRETLQALRALVPRAKKVVAFYPASSQPLAVEAMGAASSSGLTVDFHALKQLTDFQDAFRGALSGADAVWVLPDVRLGKPEIVKFMVSASLERKIPLVGFMDGMTRAGALMSVAADFVAIGREAGKLAAELAAKGAGKGEAPFRFVPGKLTVNERTRKLLSPEGKAPPGADLVEQ